MTEKVQTNEKPHEAEAPKVVAQMPAIRNSKRGYIAFSGNGWYCRVWVRLESLDQKNPTPPRYFKETDLK